MHGAQLDTITDLDTLRSIASRNIELLETERAAHRAALFVRDAELQAHAAAIATRDAAHEAQLRAHVELLAERDRTIVYKSAKIDALTLEIARLKRVQFAARSERMDPEQRALFEEALAADLAVVEAELEALREPAPARSPRRVPKRRPLPPELPRVETRHEPESCTCGACGAALVAIGEQVSEKLDVKPLEFFVRREVYPQYACRACETVVAEPVAPAIVERGIAAPGLLAQVVIAKYTDHLPLYRQEAIYARSGVEINRTTLAEWVGAVGVALAPLTAALRAELLARPVLHADETPVAQLEPGAGKTRRAYLFAYRSAVGAPLVVFDYGMSRSGSHVREFLGAWRGALVVDDYAGYKALWEKGVTELGCWAHARRKFFDLHAANKSTLAAEALKRIATLYRIESEASELDAAARHAHREQHALSEVDALFEWLTAIRPKVSAGSGTANAIDYMLKREAALRRYLGDGRYPIDNNPVENAIRPLALGRKNWLFVGSTRAGARAAAIMSLIATAKANGHEPHAWLTDVLTRLPTTLDRDIGDLLPHTWKARG
jgi:transposase